MALTKYTADTDIIESLGTTPEDRPGMTDTELKAKFDENSATWKTFWNSTASTEIDTLIENLSNITSTKTTANVIRNGCFRINQRAVSGTVSLTSGSYGHDGWKAGSGGCTYTFATSGNVTTLTISAGTLIQVVEGTELFTGTHCLSWTGTAQGKIDSGSYGASGITGSLTGGTNATIEFGTGTLSKVQLTPGSAVPTFVLRPIEQETALNQRYCYVPDTSATLSIIGVGVAYSTTQARIYVDIPTKMRAIPTRTVTATDFEVSDFVGAPVVLSALSINSVSTTDKVMLDITVASGLTQYRSYQLISVAANKKLILSAEL